MKKLKKGHIVGLFMMLLVMSVLVIILVRYDNEKPKITITSPEIVEFWEEDADVVSVVTKKEKITVRGTVSDNVLLKSLTYQIKENVSSDQGDILVVRKGTLLPKKHWKITDISLGDNFRFVEITATDWHNNKKKLTLYRPTM